MRLRPYVIDTIANDHRVLRMINEVYDFGPHVRDHVTDTSRLVLCSTYSSKSITHRGRGWTYWPFPLCGVWGIVLHSQNDVRKSKE